MYFPYFVILLFFRRFFILITQYLYNVVMFTTDNLNEFDYHGHIILDFMFGAIFIQTAIYLLWCNGFKHTIPSADKGVSRTSKYIKQRIF